MYIYIYTYILYIYIHLYLYLYMYIFWFSYIYIYGTHGNRTSCFKTEQKPPPASSERIKGYFCSDTVFNLSYKVLSQTEIRVLEKGLGFVPTPNMTNEADWDGILMSSVEKWGSCKW